MSSRRGVFTASQAKPVFEILRAPGPDKWASGVLAGSNGQALTFTRAGAKYALNSSGVLASLTNNLPVVDYRGLHVEAAATNVCLRSAAFTDAAWQVLAAVAGTVSDNAVTSPLGTTTASTFTEGTGVGQANGRYQQILFTAAAYTLSIYAKAGTGRYFTLALSNTVDDGAKFDLQTGTHIASGSNVTGARIESVGNGWYRLSVTRTMTAANNFPEFWTEQNGSTTITRAGTGTGLTFHIWGAQVELGTFASSYIATAGASASRVVDTASVPTTGWPSASGEISFRVTLPWSTSPGIVMPFQTLSGGTGIQCYFNGTTLTCDFYDPALSGTVTSINTGAQTWTPGSTYRMAFRWGRSGAKIIRNDVALASTSTAANMTAHGASCWLLNQNGAGQCGAWISDFVVRAL